MNVNANSINSNTALHEHQEKILISMGITLLLLQTTEKAINFCMTFVFQKESPLTLEKLEKQEIEEQKKTLGYFLAELRKRADLDPKFDQMLRDFLDRRNIFIHQLSEVRGLDFSTPEGRQIAEQFIGKLAGLTQSVFYIFVGFIRAWQRKLDMDTPMPLGSEEFLLYAHAAPTAIQTVSPAPQPALQISAPTSFQPAAKPGRGPRIARIRMLDGTIAGEKSPGEVS